LLLLAVLGPPTAFGSARALSVLKFSSDFIEEILDFVSFRG
jgi:hypothetical protein